MRFLFFVFVIAAPKLALSEQLSALGLMQNAQYQYESFSRWAITDLKTVTNSLSGALGLEGYRTCSSMPGSGSLTILSGDASYRFVFSPGDRNVPLDWENASETMQKKILVYKDGAATPLFQAQYYCPLGSETVSGYIRYYDNPSVGETNRYETTFEYNETTHYMRLHAATLRTTNSSSLKFAGMFYTPDGDTFEMINIYRLSDANGESAQHTQMKRALSASPSYAEIGVLFGGHYALNATPVTNATATIDTTIYDANGADYIDRACLTVAAVPSVDYLSNANCTGIAIDDTPETPAISITRWNLDEILRLTIADP